jgi:hypothetical protein
VSQGIKDRARLNANIHMGSTKKLVRREGYVVGYLVVLRKYIEKAVHMGG